MACDEASPAAKQAAINRYHCETSSEKEEPKAENGLIQAEPSADEEEFKAEVGLCGVCHRNSQTHFKCCGGGVHRNCWE